MDQRAATPLTCAEALVAPSLPSAHSALPRQQPVMRECPHVCVVRLQLSAVHTFESVQSVSDTQHAAMPPSAGGRVFEHVPVPVLHVSVVQKLLSLHWTFVVQQPEAAA